MLFSCPPEIHFAANGCMTAGLSDIFCYHPAHRMKHTPIHPVARSHFTPNRCLSQSPSTDELNSPAQTLLFNEFFIIMRLRFPSRQPIAAPPPMLVSAYQLCIAQPRSMMWYPPISVGFSKGRPWSARSRPLHSSRLPPLLATPY